MEWEELIKDSDLQFTFGKGGLKEVFDMYTRLGKPLQTSNDLKVFWDLVKKAEDDEEIESRYIEEEKKEEYAPLLKEYPKELACMNLKVKECVMVGMNNGKKMWMLEVEEI